MYIIPSCGCMHIELFSHYFWHNYIHLFIIMFTISILDLLVGVIVNVDGDGAFVVLAYFSLLQILKSYWKKWLSD